MAVKVRDRKGAWWLFVDYKGRRKAKRVGVGPAAKRAAHTAAEKIAARLALGDTSPLDETREKPTTFAEHAESWLKSYVAVQLKPSTQDMYETALRKHWTPTLGARPLTAITREQVKTRLGEMLTAGLRPSRVKGALNILRACLNAAVEDGLILGNPAARAGKFAGRAGSSREVEAFSAEELSTLLATAERDWPEAYPLVLTLARTGLRIGEALTLQVDDLDFNRRELWIRRTWGSRKKALGDRRINAPKNNRVRRVDMSQQLCRVLQGHVSLKQAEAIVAGQKPSAWLFSGPEGQPITPGAFWQNTWKPLLRRAELRHRGPHTLRHTFASLLIAQGESLAYIRDQLGHHSIKMTVDIYGHLVPGANKAAVDRLDDATGRNRAHP
ncbi:MAG: site-specific integrase [Candidatus Rokubacteria bacterium]|nr:site-specific integrase [Candidatus Rokubacteria bacterium]